MEPTTTNTSYETTPQTQPGIWAVGAKGGLYTGLVLIIFALIGFLTGLQSNTAYTYIYPFLSFIIGIYLTHKAFKDQGDGYMSYGQGLGLGTVLGLVSGLLSGIFSVVYLTIIDDSLIKSQLDQARFQLEEQGMSDAEVDQFMSYSEMVASPLGIFLMSILSYIIYAFIISLIVSAFTKNTDPTLEY